MTEEPNMSDPMTDDLHHAFDDLVGDPRPGADLASRARSRGNTLRRQRMAGGLTVVAVAGALCVPALTLVRDQAQGGGPAGASVAAQPKASDTAAADKAKAPDAAAVEKAKGEAAGASKIPGTTGVGPTEATVLKPGVLTATDNSRVAAAKALLPGFTVESTDIAVDVTSGAHVGAAVTFAAPSGGGRVGVEWSTTEASRSGKTDSKAATSSGGTSAEIGPKEGSSGPQVSGAMLVEGTTEWDVKVIQGSPGSTPILATKTDRETFLHSLAATP
jgi:hypothetical protein